MRRYCLLLMFWLAGMSATAAEVAVPEALLPWVPWVMHEVKTQDCPYFFDANRQQCQWASELRLDIDPTQGKFLQEWQLYAEGWLHLPGEAQSWPRSVQVNDAPAQVFMREGRPAVWLSPGRYVVRGEFAWTRRPEQLPLPEPLGLVQLHLDGVLRPAELDAEGRLFLRDTAQTAPAEADRLELRVFRQISDTIPLRMRVWLELEVAGKPRELLLGPVVTAGYVPLALDSPLPVRLEPDQQLRVQARPGRWRIALDFRHPGGEVNQVTRPTAAAPWPEIEVWVFAAQPNLRVVEVGGAPAVDAQQTLLPAHWRQLPAYRLEPGATLILAEQRRGDTDPPSAALHLKRELWLDFSGEGYSVRDTWNGTLSQATRLELLAGAKLGRVALAGRDQLITQLPPDNHPGVELRRGTLALSAEGRIDTRPDALPALGWNQAARSLSWQLNLPPGWRLLTAVGPDNVPGTWLQRWTMWHLFGVLLVAAALARLWSWPWGLVALVTLVLIYHEPGAPQLAWLWVVLGLGLRSVVPPTVPWLRTVVHTYTVLALLWLLALAVPFSVQQARQALYPQLAPLGMFKAPSSAPGKAVLVDHVAQPKFARSVERMAAEMPMEEPPASAPVASAGEGDDIGMTVYEAESVASADPDASMPEDKPARKSRSLQELPANTKIQTGYGLPTGGEARRVGLSLSLGWNGPVQLSERVRLILLSPRELFWVNLAQVGLIALLLAALLRSLRGAPAPLAVAITPAAGTPPSAALVGLLLCLTALVAFAPTPGYASTPPLPGTTVAAEASLFPPAGLLQELQTRLLAPPSCLPTCATWAKLQLGIQAETLRLTLTAQVLATVALPLPGEVGRWLPSAVRLDAGTPLLFRREGKLWVLLPPGQHELHLEGALPPQRTVQLALPLLPEIVELQAVQGWQVEGLRDNQQAAPVLELVREIKADAAQFAALDPSNLPAFVQVERHLDLGLDWRVRTVVRRLSPLGAAILLRVPLLPGEAVLSEGQRVEEGHAVVQLAAQARSLTWESTLTPGATLNFTAPPGESWRETWTLTAGSLWHVEAEGLVAIAQAGQGYDWLWQPYPDEQLQLHISRPDAVEGAVLTLESAVLRLTPGQRATDAVLTLSARSSLGAQHRLGLPANAQVREVQINGVVQPIRQEGASLTLPLVPGVQMLQVQWQQPETLRTNYHTPVLDLGAPAVNASLQLQVPEDRWVIWVQGPLVGPAVLFWGLLAVLLLLALGLGRYAATPLNALHWFLLLVLVSSLSIFAALGVVLWLVLLGLRPKIAAWRGAAAFNSVQVALLLFGVVALLLILGAMKSALLDAPQMHVQGNGSSGYFLQWYQDRVGADFTQARVVSLPLWSYRLLTLVWALWLAFALLDWLRWGWRLQGMGGWWRQGEAPKRRRTAPVEISPAVPAEADNV